MIGPDGPTIGGYPKVAVVLSADLAKLGQLGPGQAVRFAAVTAEYAASTRKEAAAALSHVERQINLRDTEYDKIYTQ